MIFLTDIHAKASEEKYHPENLIKHAIHKMRKTARSNFTAGAQIRSEEAQGKPLRFGDEIRFSALGNLNFYLFLCFRVRTYSRTLSLIGSNNFFRREVRQVFMPSRVKLRIVFRFSSSSFIHAHLLSCGK